MRKVCGVRAAQLARVVQFARDSSPFWRLGFSDSVSNGQSTVWELNRANPCQLVGWPVIVWPFKNLFEIGSF